MMTRSRMNWGSLLVVSAVFCGSANAAPVNAKAAEDKFAARAASLKNMGAWLDAQDAESVTLGGRSPASVNLSEVPPSYFALVQKILSIQSPDKIDALIEDLSKNYESLDPHSKWVALHIIALKRLRGIVFRAAPIYQKNHGLLSTSLRALKHAQEEIDIECPSAHCRAFYDFFLYPKSVPIDRFATVSEVSDFLTSYMGDLQATFDHLKALLPIVREHPILADLRLLRGPVQDAEKREGTLAPYQRVVTPAAIHAELAVLSGTLMHGVAAFTSYEWDDFPNVFKKFGQLYGLDGFAFEPTDGVTTKHWVELVKKRFPEFGKISRDGETSMKYAWRYLKQGASRWSAAMAQMKIQLGPQESGDLYLLRPEDFWSSPERTQLHVTNALATISGPVSLRSLLTGEEIKVDLPRLYSNPPKNLQALLPIGPYDATPRRSNKVLAGGGGVIERSWNLESERAIYWNRDQYKNFLPDFDEKKRTPRDVVRLLRETLGGEGLASFVSFFVY